MLYPASSLDQVLKTRSYIATVHLQVQSVRSSLLDLVPCDSYITIDYPENSSVIYVVFQLKLDSLRNLRVNLLRLYTN